MTLEKLIKLNDKLKAGELTYEQWHKLAFPPAFYEGMERLKEKAGDGSHLAEAGGKVLAAHSSQPDYGNIRLDHLT